MVNNIIVPPHFILQSDSKVEAELYGSLKILMKKKLVGKTIEGSAMEDDLLNPSRSFGKALKSEDEGGFTIFKLVNKKKIFTICNSKTLRGHV